MNVNLPQPVLDGNHLRIHERFALDRATRRLDHRSTHDREDHLARDDESWLAWVLLQMGQMTAWG